MNTSCCVTRTPGLLPAHEILLYESPISETKYSVEPRSHPKTLMYVQLTTMNGTILECLLTLSQYHQRCQATAFHSTHKCPHPAVASVPQCTQSD
jgi:hypothetical protein